MEDKILQLEIGGVFTVYLKKGADGFFGHYTNHRNGMTFGFDGTGMTKKQIVTKFWDKAKKVVA